MAIQDRRGAYGDFNPDKLKSGEWATVLSGDPNAADGRATYKCYEPGVVKRMATFEDMRENIEAATDEISTEYLKDLTAATERADISATNADTKAGAADTAAQNAQAVADTVQAKLDNGELKGDKGDTATIRVGTVETGEPDTEVEISNSGTVNDAVLNFKIPRDEKGDTGTAENLSDQTVNFTVASDDVDIATGEPLKTIFGKILKSIQTLRSGMAGKAAASHTHSASSITTGTLPISRGGTGQTTTSDIKSTFGITALETAVDQLKTDTGWIDLALSSANIIWSGKGKVRRVGNIAQIKFDNVRSTSTISGEIRLVNVLPSQFIPSSQQLVPILAIPGSGMRHGGYITLKTDGSVTVAPLAGDSYAPAYGVYAQVTYLID